MTKINKVSNRGTQVHYQEVGEQNWAGDSFRKQQKLRKESFGNVSVDENRGTNHVLLKDLPNPKARRSTEGMTRITGRGTGSRKSTNRGSND